MKWGDHCRFETEGNGKVRRVWCRWLQRRLHCSVSVHLSKQSAVPTIRTWWQSSDGRRDREKSEKRRQHHLPTGQRNNQWVEGSQLLWVRRNICTTPSTMVNVLWENHYQALSLFNGESRLVLFTWTNWINSLLLAFAFGKQEAINATSNLNPIHYSVVTGFIWLPHSTLQWNCFGGKFMATPTQMSHSEFQRKHWEGLILFFGSLPRGWHEHVLTMDIQCPIRPRRPIYHQKLNVFIERNSPSLSQI